MEEVMQQVATFGITFEEGITIDGRMQAIGGKLRGKVLGTWSRLQKALSAPFDQAPVSKPKVLDYYAGAYNQACASMPVISLRELV
jgi:hypothetical protein